MNLIVLVEGDIFDDLRCDFDKTKLAPQTCYRYDMVEEVDQRL